MFTKSKIKVMCLKAWLCEELLYAESQRILDLGEAVIENEEATYIRENGYKIVDNWINQGCTKKNINLLQTKIKSVKKYYNSIDNSIQKFKKLNKNYNIQDNWIPMYLCLAIGSKIKEEFVEIFPWEIDIDKMINCFTSTDKIDKKTKFMYWRLARTILEDMKKV